MIRGLVLGSVCAAVAIVWAVWHVSLQGMLTRLAETGAIRVDQAAERLVSQLERYRILANLLANDPVLDRALAAGEDAGAIANYLRDHVLTYGAERIELIDGAGSVIATSDLTPGMVSRRGDPLVRAAMTGRMGLDHVLEKRMRQFRLGRGVITGAPPPSGAVLVYVAIESLEYEWRVVPEPIAFFDDAGVVFVANRPSLLLRQDGGIEPGQRFAPFPGHVTRRVGGHEIWSFAAAPDLPAEALVITRRVPHIAMTARGFLNIAPARAAARQQALLAATGLALIGLAGVIVAMWRRRVADRLAIEAAANAQLEARVEERTAELRSTQQQLVQASKMSALGQMSAGISHELNQPLAAIMNFAENGRKLLDRDRTDDARDNFDVISQQVQRITRIIRNLRAFARSEEEPIEAVDFAAAINAARSLMEAALSKSRACVHWEVSDDPVMVWGGTVRLEQVVVNLLTNALDATADHDGAQIHVSLETDATTATLTVRDTGPGLADPARVFEPFYSTKELGASKGLGLGLSISYGIVGSFGGTISCQNHAEGGAVFVVTLPRAPEGGRE